MVLAYQIGIFLIIIISSFFGFKALLTAVSLIILFSISNIYTASLLLLQLTTITISTCIGAIISFIVMLKSIPIYIQNIKEYINNSSFDFLPSFIWVNFLRFLTSIGLFTMLYFFPIIEDLNNTFVNYIVVFLFMGYIYIVCTLGRMIKYKSNSFIEKSGFISFIVACGSIYYAKGFTDRLLFHLLNYFN